MNHAMISTVARAAMICFCATSFCANLGMGQETKSPDLVAKIIQANVAMLSAPMNFSFKVEEHESFAEPYLAMNPAKKRFDHETTLYDGIMAGEKFRVNTTITLQNGTKVPMSAIAYDGKHYGFLNSEGSPFIVFSKKRDDAPRAISLGTFMYLTYAFLFDTKDDSDLPVFSASDIANEHLWQTVFAKAKITRMPNADDPTMEVRLENPNGTAFIVVFSQSYVPVKIEKYNNKNHLTLSCSVNTWEKPAGSSPATILFPKSVTVQTFLDGWLRQTFDAKLLEMSVKPSFDEEDFELDVSAVDTILDRDTNTRITVPH